MGTDLSPNIQAAFFAFWYFIPLAVLVGIVKTPWFKGVFGEFLVNMSAQLFLPKNTYHLIRDVTLPIEAGTTQIDHIIVSVYGVFVVETKNMGGWIYGSIKQKMWTQKIHKASNTFQNPLHQNYLHIRALEALLHIPLPAFHSLVVFAGGSTFKSDVPDNVTNIGGYIRYIKSMQDVVLTRTDVDVILKELEELRLKRGISTTRQHIRNTRQNRVRESFDVPRAVNTSAPTPPKKCPRCGGGMVLRTNSKGAAIGRQFWGCATFPACGAVLPISKKSSSREITVNASDQEC